MYHHEWLTLTDDAIEELHTMNLLEALFQDRRSEKERKKKCKEEHKEESEKFDSIPDFDHSTTKSLREYAASSGKFRLKAAANLVHPTTWSACLCYFEYG